MTGLKKYHKSLCIPPHRSSNPAKLDKSLFAGIIYAKRVDNSATVTKQDILSGR